MDTIHISDWHRIQIRKTILKRNNLDCIKILLQIMILKNFQLSLWMNTLMNLWNKQAYLVNNLEHLC